MSKMVDRQMEVIKAALGDDCKDLKKIEAALEEYWSDKVASYWTIYDVMGLDKTLTAEDAIEILDNLDHNFDGSVGITWNVIEEAIYSFKQGKK
jgi:hypothetical protein